MPLFSYHIASARHAPLLPVAELPTIEAAEPFVALAAAEKLATQGLLPSEIGETFWVRFVVGERDGKYQVASVPLTPEAKILLDWRPGLNR
jgi:hypothetical protein